MSNIKYRKNDEWDIIKIPSSSYNKKNIANKFRSYLKENSFNNHYIDIIETIPMGDELIIQFAIMKQK